MDLDVGLVVVVIRVYLKSFAGRCGDRRLDGVANGEGNGLRLEMSRGAINDGADGDDLAVGHGSLVDGFAKLKGIADGTGAKFCDGEEDIDFVFEAEWGEEIASGVDARPTGDESGKLFVIGEVEGAKEGVFGRLHHSVKIGEVNDAGEIGFKELDATGEFKFVSHGLEKLEERLAERR